MLAFLAVAILLSLDAHAKLYQSYSELDPSSKYDFIIVGSGPGGATVASRLSEDPNFNVLLIEAGPDNEGVLSIQVPGLNNEIPSVYDWNYTTKASAAINNRSIAYGRGHVLGGSSSVNGMIYSRGAADDYNSWAEITGDGGWSWDSLWPFIKKNERLVPPAGGRNTTGEYDPGVHGYDGSTFVSLPTFPATDFDMTCLETANSQDEFAFNLDMNSGCPIGLTWAQYTIGNGERYSAATSYLNATVRQRPNLGILINTYVTRVIPTLASEHLDIRTVEVGDHTSRRILGNLTATKEVILSAGTFGSPQILLNSGIGETEAFQALGVRPIHSLPDVGKNMIDHIAAFTLWSATGSPSSPPIDSELALKEWNQTRTGIYTQSGLGVHMISWSRIPYTVDPSSGPNTPHIESVLFSTPDSVSSVILLLTPNSRGSVTLRSNDPFDDPIIDPGILETTDDVLAMKEGFRLVARFFSDEAWSSYNLSSTFIEPDSVTDAEWETYIRSTAGPGYHAVGTAAMSKEGTIGGVVDCHLRVKGISGLRIVDASVMPVIPTGHTQAPTYIVGERAASLIKAYWTGK